MITRYKKIIVLVNTDTFEKLLGNQNVEDFYESFGLDQLIKTFHINKNKLHSLSVNAVYTDGFEMKRLDSSNMLFFKSEYISNQKINEFASEKGLISRLGLDDKFIKIANNDGLFYVHNIYSLIDIPSKAKEFVEKIDIPKIETKRNKLVLG